MAPTSLVHLSKNAFDLTAVDVEFPGDGALAVARLVPRADGLVRGWRDRESGQCISYQRWCSLVLRLALSPKNS
jgi:hypothetical protein